MLADPRAVVDAVIPEPLSPPTAPTTILSRQGCRCRSRASKKVTRRAIHTVALRCVLLYLFFPLPFPIKNKTKSSLSKYNESRTQ